MKVMLDDEVLYEIDDRMIALIAHDVEDPIAHIKHLLRYFVQHKCDQCFQRMEKEYIDVLRNDDIVKSIPKSRTEFVDLVTSRKDYKNRKQRKLEEEIIS